MKIVFPVLAIAALLYGCGLTPAQLKAIGESKSSTTACFSSKTMGFETATVVTVAGQNGGTIQVLPNCATAQASK